MPFPLGGDFSRTVQSAFKVLKADKRICRHENGTSICDLGHKLKFPGTCLSQPIGTFNSTDATFQPTFPVCTSDYESEGFNPGLIFSSAPIEGAGTVYSRSFSVTHDQPLFQLLKSVLGEHLVFSLQREVDLTINFAQVGSSFTRTIVSQAVGSTYDTFLKVGQFNPGTLPYQEGIFSDLYVYDVASSLTTYSRLAFHLLEITTPAIEQEGPITFNRNLVQTDYYTTISGEVDICAGDEAPPVISYVQPVASGTVLRPTNQIVEFTLSDSPGGVDLSKLFVRVNSTTSGTLQLVSAGADVSGGRVSITGDSSSYRVRYTPNFTWLNNDKVVVTISGADLPPTVGGNPFYCGAAGVNYFTGDITFKVQTPSNMGASITAIGDVAAPYIVSATPVSGTLNNDVFSPVVIVLADDLTGIDLSTMTIVVDSEAIVIDGLATSSEVSITGLPSSYTITYNKSTAFEYGSVVEVEIYVGDRAKPSSNVLSTSYTFSCIGDGTLRIENFYPEVGTTVNPETIDIEVDVLDDTFGIDEDQSFLVVDGQIVNATVTPVTSGIHFRYHPPNDFAFERPIVVKVHGVNDNPSAPVVKESIYTLYYGQRILLHNGGPYGYGQQVDVFVHARNVERLHKDLSTGYLFTARTQPRADIGAYVEAITPYSDIDASLTAQGPEHRYGRTVTVTFYAEDFEGHALGPYTYTYTIEEE